MANKNFKARIGIEAPLIAADNGTTAITLTGADVEVEGILTVTGNTIKSSTGDAPIAFSGADVTVAGDLTVTGNDIKSSGGTTAITLTGLGGVTIAGDLQLNGGDIFSSTGVGAINVTGADVGVQGDLYVYGNDIKSSTLATAITLSGANVILPGTLDVQGGTISDSTGALSITTGASNGNITLAPNGSGDIVLTLANGGNLTNSRNYVFGAIRNSTTESNGDIWALNAGSNTTPTRGISIDNSADTAKTASYLARTYGATAGNRSRIILERARGTAASPTAVQVGDLLGEIDVTGYSSTGWINDTISAVPGFFGFTATENWVSNTNLGTTFALNLAPTATTITAGTNLIPTIQSTPQFNYFRSDRFAVAQGKTAAFTATGCSVSGTTLTIGTLASGTIAVGQALTFTTTSANSIYILANISGSGSGSTWQLSETPGTLTSQGVTGNTGFIAGPTAATTVDALQDLKLVKNVIKGSGGTTQITTSSAGATLALAGDTISFTNAAGAALANSQLNYSRTYGEFSYTNAAGFGFAAQNTIYLMPLDTTNYSSNTSISNTSRINITKTGKYKIIMSLQAIMSTNSVGQFDFWLRKNGTDLANSKTQVDLLKDQKSVVSMDWMVDCTATTDYWEIAYASASANYANIAFPTIAATTSPFVSPVAPAVIFNVIPVGA